MMKKDEEALLEASNELIETLELAVQSAQKENGSFSEQWQNPEIIQSRLLPQLQDSIKEYRKDLSIFASFQVGLAKIFDQFYFEWSPVYYLEINTLVRKVVSLALTVMAARQQKITGIHSPPHEDGACIVKPLGPRFNGGIVFSLNGGQAIPAKHSACFINKPQSLLLKKEQKFYRVIEDGVNNPHGEWWIIDESLNNKAEWRSKFAVLQKWNDDSSFVSARWDSDFPTYVWQGAAASQQATDTCILEGGCNQIWIHSDILKKMKVSGIQKICWPLKAW